MLPFFFRVNQKQIVFGKRNVKPFDIDNDIEFKSEEKNNALKTFIKNVCPKLSSAVHKKALLHCYVVCIL